MELLVFNDLAANQGLISNQIAVSIIQECNLSPVNTELPGRHQRGGPQDRPFHWPWEDAWPEQCILC